MLALPMLSYRWDIVAQHATVHIDSDKRGFAGEKGRGRRKESLPYSGGARQSKAQAV